MKYLRQQIFKLFHRPHNQPSSSSTNVHACSSIHFSGCSIIFVWRIKMRFQIRFVFSSLSSETIRQIEFYLQEINKNVFYNCHSFKGSVYFIKVFFLFHFKQAQLSQSNFCNTKYRQHSRHSLVGNVLAYWS